MPTTGTWEWWDRTRGRHRGWGHWPTRRRSYWSRRPVSGGRTGPDSPAETQHHWTSTPSFHVY